MKTITLTLLLAFLSILGFAQNRQVVDSLKHELAIATHDTSRVLIMTELGVQYRTTNADSIFMYGKKALALAKQIKFLKGELRSMNQMGRAQRQMENYTEAFAMALKGLRMAEKYKYLAEIADFHNLLGTIYQDFKNQKKAIYHFLIAIKIAESLRDERNKAGRQTNLTLAYFESNQLDSAYFYATKAHQVALGFKDKQLLTITLRNLGRIQFAKGNFPEALDYYRQSLQNALSIGNNKGYSAYIYNLMGAVYLKNSQTDSCIFYAKQALLTPMAVQKQRRNIESYTLLVDAYKSKKDFRQALAYKELLDATKEELFGESNMQAIQTLLDQDQDQQKQLEIERIAYENQLKQTTFLVGLGVFLLIAIILYRNNRQKQKANIILENTLSTLKSTQAQLIQSEKLASLGELTAGIAHEIQNPLNFVNNFSEVNTELIDELEQEINKGNYNEVKLLAKDIKENEQKINHHGKRAGDIVKGMLQHSSSASGKKEPTDINKLADEYLRLSYHGLRSKDKNFNATMKIDFDETIGNINIIPQDMGRVILNLITNAFYAVHEKSKQGIAEYDPTVSIRTKMVNDKVEIKVTDNGNGIPEKILDKIFQPFFTTKPTGQGIGLGLSLSYDIVKAHGGTMEVQSTNGVGSEFIINLPFKTIE